MLHSGEINSYVENTNETIENEEFHSHHTLQSTSQGLISGMDVFKENSETLHNLIEDNNESPINSETTELRQFLSKFNQFTLNNGKFL